jgi:ubiquinone/menaquinone biosynthesis C-methylase UbiE
VAVEHQTPPSLENLIEAEALGFEILHPGGLQLTAELAELCHIDRSGLVLDVASGTGESACYLAQNFGCSIVGLDASDYMVERAKAKAAVIGLDVQFLRGDGENLPFADDTFDAVISECTTCILDKEVAIRAMTRVARPGGYIGIHDLCWKKDTPQHLKQRLAEIEGEDPETLDGWKDLFERAGLVDVVAEDRSQLIPDWTKGIKRQLGISGQLRIFAKVIKRWGLHGYRTISESERIFRDAHTGYGMIVGRKP